MSLLPQNPGPQLPEVRGHPADLVQPKFYRHVGQSCSPPPPPAPVPWLETTHPWPRLEPPGSLVPNPIPTESVTAPGLLTTNRGPLGSPNPHCLPQAVSLWPWLTQATSSVQPAVSSCRQPSSGAGSLHWLTPGRQIQPRRHFMTRKADLLDLLSALLTLGCWLFCGIGERKTCI